MNTPKPVLKKFYVDPSAYATAVEVAKARGEVLAEVLRDRVAGYVAENTDRRGNIHPR